MLTLHRILSSQCFQIRLRQHCTRKLLAQCWPREHRHSFAGKPAVSNMSGDLIIKGTLMQISRSSYVFVFIWKQYPENLAFLTLRILQLITREFRKFVNFLKIRLIFNIFYCFWMFLNKTFPYLTWAYLKKVKGVLIEIFNMLFLGQHCAGVFLLQCCLRRIWQQWLDNIHMPCCPLTDTTLQRLFY